MKALIRDEHPFYMVGDPSNHSAEFDRRKKSKKNKRKTTIGQG